VKFTIAQLRKLSMPYQFSEDIDLSSDLNGLEDILKILSTHVTETVYNRGDDSYRIDFSIDCNLVLSDSITLEEIEYPIKVSASEVFSTNEDEDDAFLIEGITLDTKEAIITNILCNKPMSITNYEDEISDVEEDNKEDDHVNPAFASLKDLL
jgi:uncharacterized metal-binding protein YceD (DUF177 family)